MRHVGLGAFVRGESESQGAQEVVERFNMPGAVQARRNPSVGAKTARSRWNQVLSCLAASAHPWTCPPLRCTAAHLRPTSGIWDTYAKK